MYYFAVLFIPLLFKILNLEPRWNSTRKISSYSRLGPINCRMIGFTTRLKLPIFSVNVSLSIIVYKLINENEVRSHNKFIHLEDNKPLYQPIFTTYWNIQWIDSQVDFGTLCITLKFGIKLLPPLLKVRSFSQNLDFKISSNIVFFYRKWHCRVELSAQSRLHSYHTNIQYCTLKKFLIGACAPWKFFRYGRGHQ